MPEIYHILNRGVDKRSLFLDDTDRFRFIHDLFELNNQEIVNTSFYSFSKSNDTGCRKIKKGDKQRKLLVNIYAFCLMPNHYHLLLSPNIEIENGVPKFMHKLNMGYSKYFNTKHERKGTLFEGKYKIILVTKEVHFLHLPYYIHLNPLDLKTPEWRNGLIHNYKETIRFLESYKWSSHLDYIGKRNFPSVTNRKFLLDFFEGTENYKDKIYGWLKNMDMEKIQDVALE